MDSPRRTSSTAWIIVRGDESARARRYGPRGAGKRTCCGAVAKDLGCDAYRVEARDVLGFDHDRRDPADAARRLRAVVDDARLSDAALVIDGFEHAFAANARAQEGEGLVDLTPGLARALDVVATFPGVVLLVAHVEDPRALRLAPQFARRLRFALPRPDRAGPFRLTRTAPKIVETGCSQEHTPCSARRAKRARSLEGVGPRRAGARRRTRS